MLSCGVFPLIAIFCLFSKHRSVLPVLEECLEILYLTLAANEDGVLMLFESEGVRALASQVSTLPDGNSSDHYTGFMDDHSSLILL